MSAARDRIKMSNADIVDHFKRLGYFVAYETLAFTTESIEDFAEARGGWAQRGKLVDYQRNGLIIISNAQPLPEQPPRDIIVVSLGSARSHYGCIESTRRNHRSASLREDDVRRAGPCESVRLIHQVISSPR